MENPPYFLAKSTNGVISSLYSTGNTLICSSTVANLEDVVITDQQGNETLMYDSATSKWVNRKISLSTDTTDFVITSPANGDKLYFNSSLNTWNNVQPMFYSTVIYGKLKDSSVNTLATLNLFDSANYDTFNEGSTSSFGITRTGASISGFRTASTWKLDVAITLSMTSITDQSRFTYEFKNIVGPAVISSEAFNTTNNPSKVLCLNSVQSSLNIATQYAPSLQLGSPLGSPTYVGNAVGDISLSFSIVEI